MRRAIFTMLAVGALIGPGCTLMVIDGSGEIATETRDVGGFQAVALSGAGEVTLVRGSDEAVTVTADDNLMEYIETKVENGVLNIGWDARAARAMLRPSAPVRFVVTYTGLGAIAVSGSGSVRADSLLAESLDIAVSGSGDVGTRAVSAARVSVAVSGSGDVDVAGSAEALAVAISGSGTYSGRGLRAARATVAVSGSGTAEVWAEEELNVRITGSGDVTYFGSPTVEQVISGAGRIRSAGSGTITL